MNAFIHKPKGPLSEVYVHPLNTKPLWNKLWDAAKAQDWFADDVGYVGNKDGWHYFQKRGLTTGFARIKI